MANLQPVVSGLASVHHRQSSAQWAPFAADTGATVDRLLPRHYRNASPVDASAVSPPFASRTTIAGWSGRSAERSPAVFGAVGAVVLFAATLVSLVGLGLACRKRNIVHAETMAPTKTRRRRGSGSGDPSRPAGETGNDVDVDDVVLEMERPAFFDPDDIDVTGSDAGSDDVISWPAKSFSSLHLDDEDDDEVK